MELNNCQKVVILKKENIKILTGVVIIFVLATRIMESFLFFLNIYTNPVQRFFMWLIEMLYLQQQRCHTSQLSLSLSLSLSVCSNCAGPSEIIV